MTMGAGRGHQGGGFVERGELERVQRELADLKETLRALLDRREDGVRRKEQLELPGASVVALPLPPQAQPQPPAPAPSAPPPAPAPVVETRHERLPAPPMAASYRERLPARQPVLPPPPAEEQVSLHVYCSRETRDRITAAVGFRRRSNWIVSVIERELEALERYQRHQR